MAQTMAERIAAKRRREFVGRAREIAALRAVLTRDRDEAALFVSGPGGIGKTTLLARYADLGRELGRRVVRIDARDVPPIPSEFAAELERQREKDPLDGSGPPVGGLLLLVDTAERLVSMEPWLRQNLLPSLPGDAVVVLAGREPASVEWRTDPGWQGLLLSISLTNLSLQESSELLERRGLPRAQHGDALAFTRGHPLALALVADVAAQSGEALPPNRLQGVINTLLANFVESVPSKQHRQALEACAQVLTTTEPLLAELLGLSDAHDLFAWLRSLSIIETGPRGVYPHDIARDTLDAELRWRNPERYSDIHHRAGALYRRQFFHVPLEMQQQVLVEYVFLHRRNPILGPFVNEGAESGMDLRTLMATPASEGERQMAVEMVARHEGEESARLTSHWMDRQPGFLRLIRAPDGEILGLVGTLDLARVGSQDRLVDPAVDRVCAVLEERGGLNEGETAGFFRFWMQRERYQEFGPIQLFITLHFVRYYLSTRGLSFSFVYYADPGLWADICRYADMQRLPEADFEVGGRRYGVYGHDWRRTPPIAWLELLGDRELADGAVTAEPDPAGSRSARRLSDTEFSTAVKAALNELGRATGLRGSPLLDSPLVASRVADDADERTRIAELRRRISEAAARLEASPRDRRGFRALHHTYLQPAATQSAAAELLALPTTTYRRHLAWGIARITELLRIDDMDSGKPN